MPERRVPQIVAQCDRFDQVLIQAQRFRDRARILGDLQRMRHSGPVMIAVRRQKHLRLILEASERLAVQDPVSVPLENRPDIALFFRLRSALGLGRKRCPRGQDLFFT